MYDFLDFTGLGIEKTKVKATTTSNLPRSRRKENDDDYTSKCIMTTMVINTKK